MRHGERTYALQCHPEITIEGFKRWQDAEWAPWGNPGVQPREEQDALAASHDQLQDAWFRAFLDKLFGPRGEP
jgi:GMP synthase-like glutamine amidotransferase